MDKREMVIGWLQDAHAMERALVQVLEHRIKDAEGYPQVQSTDRQHLEETKRHAQQVEQCLKQLGAGQSTAKSLIGTLFGAVQAPMTGIARDELVKNCLTDYAAEHFEVASYASLVAAAREIGETDIANICQQIMEEDLAMANRILEMIPTVTTQRMTELSMTPPPNTAGDEPRV